MAVVVGPDGGSEGTQGKEERGKEGKEGGQRWSGFQWRKGGREEDVMLHCAF